MVNYSTRLHSNALQFGNPSRDAIAGANLAQLLRINERWLENFRALFRTAQNITDCLPKDSLARGIILSGDISPELKRAAEEIVKDKNPVNAPDLKLGKYLTQTAIAAETLGGGAIVLEVNDGGELDEPVKLDKIKNVKIVGYFNAYEIYPDYEELGWWSGDLEPNYYQVQTHHLSASQGQKIHRSRVLPINGRFSIGKEISGQVNSWWMSDTSLRTCIPAIIRHDLAETANTNRLIRNGAIIMQIQDLIENLDKNANSNIGFNAKSANNYTDKKYEQRIRDRAEIVAQQLGSLRVLLADKDKEDLQYQESDFSHIPENLDSLKQSIVIESNLPAFKVFGQFIKSMGTLNEGDRQEYALQVEEYRNDNYIGLYGAIAQTLTYWMLSQENPYTKGKLPKDWSFEFPPVYRPTDAEQAKTDSLKAASLRQIQNVAKVASDIEQAGKQPAITTEELRDRMRSGNYLGVDLPLDSVDRQPEVRRDRLSDNWEIIRRLKNG